MTAPESNLVEDTNTAVATPDFIVTLSVENHSYTIQSDPPIEDAPTTSGAPPFLLKMKFQVLKSIVMIQTVLCKRKSKTDMIVSVNFLAKMQELRSFRN